MSHIRNAPIGKVRKGDEIDGSGDGMRVQGRVTGITRDGTDYLVHIKQIGHFGVDSYYLPAEFRVTIDRS